MSRRWLLILVAALAAACSPQKEAGNSTGARLSAPEPVFQSLPGRGTASSGAVDDQGDSGSFTVPSEAGDLRPSRRITDDEFAASLPGRKTLAGGRKDEAKIAGAPVKPSGTVVSLTADNYASIAGAGDRPVFIKYGYPGCLWCRVVDPVLPGLAKREDLAGVVFADADVHGPRPAPVPEGVRGYPAFVYVKGGKTVYMHEGLDPKRKSGESKEAFEKRLEEWLAGLIREHLLGGEARSAAARTFGLIVNGDREAHHLSNVKRVSAFFKSHYGVENENLFVLSPGAPHAAVKTNVLGAAAALKGRLGPEDKLVIYTTGHGTRSGGRTQLVLQEGLISDAEFARAVLDTRAGSTVYIGDQCFSGGFTAAMTATGKRVIAMSASDASHTTYCQSFINPFLAAFGDLSVDTNGDGRVDEGEAFTYARRRHRQTLDPASSNAQWRTSGYGSS